MILSMTQVWLIVMSCIQFSSFLTAYRTPHILDPDRPKDLYFQEGDTAVISCKARSEPASTYKWTKSGAYIATDARVKMDATSGNLSIANFTSSDEGVYTCVASNVFQDDVGRRATPASLSPEVTLYLHRLDKFTDDSSVFMKVTEYDYIQLKCDKKGKLAGPTFSYNWYNGTSTYISMDGGRIFVDTNGNLHISYVLAKDVGNYRCHIAGFKLIRWGRTYHLDVTKTNKAESIKPQIRHRTTGLIVHRLATVRLECFFSGHSMEEPRFPVTRWQNAAGQEIVSDKTKYILSEHGRVLTVLAVQKQDEGRYHCYSWTAAGKSETLQVSLNLTSPPVFIHGAPGDQTVIEHADAVFHCDAKSADCEEATQLPVWYINGEKLGSITKNSHMKFSIDKSTLTVLRVKKPRDIMCVQCQVTNHFGTIWGNACLNVIAPIIFSKRPALRQEIRYGDTVDLTINASTDPSLSLDYRWEFRNKSYSKPESIPHVTCDRVAQETKINTRYLSRDELRSICGTYRAFISHVYETKIVEVEVVLNEADPQVIPQTHSSTLLKTSLQVTIIVIISFIIILCIATAIFLIKIALRRRRRRTEAATRSISLNQNSGSEQSHDYINTSSLQQNGVALTSETRVSETVYENCLGVTETGFMLATNDQLPDIYENVMFYYKKLHFMKRRL